MHAVRVRRGARTVGKFRQKNTVRYTTENDASFAIEYVYRRLPCEAVNDYEARTQDGEYSHDALVG